MNITLSVDERLVVRARKVAKSMGKSLNQVIREHLEDLTSKPSADEWIAEIRRLSDLGQGRSGGHRFDREEAHARRP
ncbi:MAG: MerR family transcriptional regulator [Acidobacteria bacterium]|nr:MerR family transcriptional regulator [Acidobacteriota bacterium]